MRILVVEDEPKIAAFIQRGLEEEQYVVDVVEDGETAVAWASVTPYDLLVLDILLPLRDGLSVCRELRRRGIRTPVLMLTAKDTVDDRVAGLDSGADDYLVKPFAFKELLARLRALARRTPALTGPVLSLADLQLDTVRHQATRAGRPIELTAKEYALLELLLRHPHQVLSRTLIAEHVWSYDFYSQSNVVDVYIRNLRRKLDDGYTPKLIHTVRGVGYKLTEESEDDTL
ncbi:MAG: response regulator transcription factor [Chloroflexota bacterium]|nr:response regulator transcription factor [Chloroflexota bacterium]